jgi:aryl-alcohol dehydrogenase-like predicted oxidoreductase
VRSGISAPRERLVVATKVFSPMGPTPNEAGLSRKHIMHAIDASLTRLGMDYVDLYQIHRFDPTTPDRRDDRGAARCGESGQGALYRRVVDVCVAVREISPHADAMGKTRFVSMQNHYNAVYREEEREMMPLCRAEGIGVIPWSPLARGFLAGNRRRQDRGETARAKSDEFAHAMYYQDGDFDVVEKVGEIAQKRGVSNAQVALAWLLHRPGVTAPIVGASNRIT